MDIAILRFFWGGTNLQTSKLKHTQTNSPSMHFICENTNSYVIRCVIRESNFLKFFRKNKLIYDKNMSFSHLLGQRKPRNLFMEK